MSALIPDAGDALQPALHELARSRPSIVSSPTSISRAARWTRPALDELAKSIKANGIIQPIIVRRVDNGRYQIIAGERRWRAAQRAGLVKVPIVIKDVAAATASACWRWR